MVMDWTLNILGWIFWGCYIYVLIKVFKREGLYAGLLGILCGLFPFLWGWFKAEDRDVHYVMIVWTIVFIAGILALIYFPIYSEPFDIRGM